MAQISITGKDEEIIFIQESYNKLGIKRSPRLVDLAINDINKISNRCEIDDCDYNLLSYEIKKFDEKFKNEINLFESILTRIKTKINSNYDDAIKHFPMFVKMLYNLKEKLDNNRKTLENSFALYEEWDKILILIEHLQNNEKGKIYDWYSKYKKSNVIYEYFKSKYGFSDAKINQIQKFVKKLSKKDTFDFNEE